MKRSRAVEALRLIRKRPRIGAGMLAHPLGLEYKDLDGFLNPLLGRLGYLVGWLHGARLVKISHNRRRTPRGESRLTITRKGISFLRDSGGEGKE